MQQFGTFFKESNSSLGLFYPKHYILATFHNYSDAARAFESLKFRGVPDDEVMVATGQEFLNFFQHFKEDAGLWGIIMRPLSRFIAGEASHTDMDIEDARHGAGFLAVYGKTEERASKIMDVVEKFAPSSAEWYLTGGIRRLI